MAARPSARFPDRLIWQLASRRHGVVARRQLLGLGVTRHQIALRLGDGRLTELHRGVYLVGAVASEHAHAKAALLACGSGAVLSHFSAARLWAIRAYPAAAHACVTVPSTKRIDRPRIRVHRADITAPDVRRRHGMSLTSPPRTVLDCAALGADPYELEALVAEASYRGVAREPELADQIARNPGRRGVGALREVLDLPGGARRTRSPAERALLRLLRREGIEGYQTNSRIHGRELDFVWHGLNFAVELDGWDGHSGKVAFERDRLKIAELQARGVKVMPVTARQIDKDPLGVASRLGAALEITRKTTRT